MKLEDLPKENIYQVPQHYFDKLPNRVMMRVQENNLTKPVSLWNQQKYSYMRSALAGLILILTFIFIFRISSPSNPNATSTDLLAHISDKEALAYLITSEKLEMQDLSLLSQAHTDLSPEFIQVSPDDVIRALDEVDLDELELN